MRCHAWHRICATWPGLEPHRLASCKCALCHGLACTFLLQPGLQLVRLSPQALHQLPLMSLHSQARLTCYGPPRPLVHIHADMQAACWVKTHHLGPRALSAD